MSFEHTQFTDRLLGSLQQQPGVTCVDIGPDGLQFSDVDLDGPADTRLDEAVREAAGTNEFPSLGEHPLGVVLVGSTALSLVKVGLQRYPGSAASYPLIQASLLLPTQALDLGRLEHTNAITESWLKHRLSNRADAVRNGPGMPETHTTITAVDGLFQVYRHHMVRVSAPVAAATFGKVTI